MKNKDNLQTLTKELISLKNDGKSFLACVAYVQKSQNSSLVDAKNLLLELKVYSNTEKQRINEMLNVCLDELNDDEKE